MDPKKEGPAPEGPAKWRGKAGPGPLRRVRPVPGDCLIYVFNGILYIQSVENPIRKVHSVKKIACGALLLRKELL